MREDYATDVGDANTRFSQTFMESVIRCLCFWTGVDERDGIFRDQIHINGANVERRGQ
jgi:hypothetical protein